MALIVLVRVRVRERGSLLGGRTVGAVEAPSGLVSGEQVLRMLQQVGSEAAKQGECICFWRGLQQLQQTPPQFVGPLPNSPWPCRVRGGARVQGGPLSAR